MSSICDQEQGMRDKQPSIAGAQKEKRWQVTNCGKQKSDINEWGITVF